jgi:hypothetical protein
MSTSDIDTLKTKLSGASEEELENYLIAEY